MLARTTRLRMRRIVRVSFLFDGAGSAPARGRDLLPSRSEAIRSRLFTQGRGSYSTTIQALVFSRRPDTMGSLLDGSLASLTQIGN